MNADELRDALLDQERFAPAERAVLDELSTLTRPRRHLPGWATGLLAAAAVVGIVAGVTTLASPTTPTPATTTTATTPSTSTAAPITSKFPQQAPTSVDQLQSSREAQAQLEAEQAGSSAEAAAQAAADAGAKSAAECNATIKSRRIPAIGAVDAATIRAVVSGCANAWGPEGGYTVEWVQTTLGKLQTLSTGHVSHAATPLVAIQVHAVFTKGGQAGPAETMLIRLFFGGTPSGVEVPVNPVNLAALGVVHRLG